MSYNPIFSIFLFPRLGFRAANDHIASHWDFIIRCFREQTSNLEHLLVDRRSHVRIFLFCKGIVSKEGSKAVNSLDNVGRLTLRSSEATILIAPAVMHKMKLFSP